jgi:hypothetical protein
MDALKELLCGQPALREYTTLTVILARVAQPVANRYLQGYKLVDA